MQDDDLKRLWQAQRFDAPPVLPDEQQLAAMKKKMKGFDRAIFWRDGRECLAGIFLIIWFGRAFFTVSEPIAKTGALIIVLASAFVCWYPIREKRRVAPAAPDASMTEALQCELEKVKVQIRLLRSVLWWYLMPLGVGVLVFVFGLERSLPNNLGFAAFVAVLYVFIYWLNQWSVRKYLVPLKQEIEATLQFDGSMAPPEPEKKNLLAKTLFLGIVLASLGTIAFIRDHQPVTKYGGYAKVAPYTGVRWENDRPIVQVQGRWSPLVSIDGIPAKGIMEFARLQFGDLARKRFAEDLVELLSTMGHNPEWTVTLGLERENGQVEEVRIKMTAHNRKLVRDGSPP
ncbi:MAG: SoxR reducing system RseC family protein [Verrucomicrobiota bacterium]